MESEDVQGGVIEIRPKGLYRVRLEDGRIVTANVASSLRHAIVRILVDDEVSIRLSQNDPHRGQITQVAD